MIVRITASATRQCFLRPITPNNSSRIAVLKFTVYRSYATHRSNASDLLSQTLDVKRGSRREDTVGPFVLGVPPSKQSAENVKKWSELSTGGKGVLYEHAWSMALMPAHPPFFFVNKPFGLLQGQGIWSLYSSEPDSLPFFCTL